MPSKSDSESSTQTPSVFLPYQANWCNDKSQIKVYEKSRRIGISWADAADAALTAGVKNGSDVWYVGYNYDMANQYIRDVAMWSEHFGIAVEPINEIVVKDPANDILAFRVNFASGFRVTALSSRPANLRSKKGSIRIDEAAFHDDLGELLKAAIAIIMWGGSVAIWSTHNGAHSEFNKMIQRCRVGELNYSLHRCTFSEAIEQGLYRRICLVNGTPWSQESEDTWVKKVYEDYGSGATEELDCIPYRAEGRVYRAFDSVLNHCIDAATQAERIHIGLDFNVGKCAGVAHVIRNGLPVAIGEFHDILDTPDLIKAIKARFPEQFKARRILVYPDAAGKARKTTNASQTDIDLLKQAGLNVIVDPSNPAVKDRINSMNTMFCNALGMHRYLVNTRLCPFYTEALEQQIYDKHGKPDKSGDDLISHILDAAGYFIHQKYSVQKSARTEPSFTEMVTSTVVTY